MSGSNERRVPLPERPPTLRGVVIVMKTSPMTKTQSIGDELNAVPAHRHYASSLRAIMPATIPVAMFLIVASLASSQEAVQPTRESTAESLNSELVRHLSSTESSTSLPVLERVRLDVSRSRESGEKGTAQEAERQLAEILARRMDSLNFTVTICVGEPQQLPLAESLAASMIEERAEYSDRIALRLDPSVVAGSVEFVILRTLDTLPGIEAEP